VSDGSVTQKLSTEGADMLTLAGVNDANLIELSRLCGVKVSLRGDNLSITGPQPLVERATDIGRRMVDRARQRMDLTPDDVLRLSEDDGNGGDGAHEGRIALPGVRRLIQAKTSGQAEYLQKIAENDIVVGIGPAGTGKTYLAVAAAVDALTRKKVRKIVLARPAVEAGESLGFLPGDMQAKVDPYLRPLYDALYDLMGFDAVNRAFERRELEIAPLAFMRGRTLNNAFVILDEAQNTTPEQMKMFLTRLGFSSRCVVTGDTSQIDLPKGATSGLVDAERVLKHVTGIAFAHFTSADVVRHPLVARIVDAYDAQRRAREPGH
jgi:phosphate starvation-inducible PhoH-like protein